MALWIISIGVAIIAALLRHFNVSVPFFTEDVLGKIGIWALVISVIWTMLWLPFRAHEQADERCETLEKEHKAREKALLAQIETQENKKRVNAELGWHLMGLEQRIREVSKMNAWEYRESCKDGIDEKTLDLTSAIGVFLLKEIGPSELALYDSKVDCEWTKFSAVTQDREALSKHRWAIDDLVHRARKLKQIIEKL